MAVLESNVGYWWTGVRFQVPSMLIVVHQYTTPSIIVFCWLVKVCNVAHRNLHVRYILRHQRAECFPHKNVCIGVGMHLYAQLLVWLWCWLRGGINRVAEGE